MILKTYDDNENKYVYLNINKSLLLRNNFCFYNIYIHEFFIFKIIFR